MHSAIAGEPACDPQQQCLSHGGDANEGTMTKVMRPFRTPCGKASLSRSPGCSHRRTKAVDIGDNLLDMTSRHPQVQGASLEPTRASARRLPRVRRLAACGRLRGIGSHAPCKLATAHAVTRRGRIALSIVRAASPIRALFMPPSRRSIRLFDG